MDLDYPAADSLARLAVNDTTATSRQRLEALTYLGLAAWPSDTTEVPRRAATADSAFGQVLRDDPDAQLDREVSWAGARDRFEEVRRRTLAAVLRLEGLAVATGPGGAALVRYRTTRSAAVQLELFGPGMTAPEVIGRAGPDTAGAFQVALNGIEQPKYPSGRYDLVLRARDRGTGEEVLRQYEVLLESTPVTYVPVNPPGDPPGLLPEIGPPRRLAPALTGLVGGALTMALASSFRAEGQAGSQTGTNPQGVAVGVGFALGGLVAAFTAHPRPLPENQRTNIEARDDWENARNAQKAENLRLASGIRTTFRILEVTP
jgi:hypothetical protein